jgi:hypothetical protein
VPYLTKDSIRNDLKQLGVTSWDWPGDKPGALRPDVKKRLPTSGGAEALDEIVEYCWTAYEKSYRSTGDLVIGRVDHLNAAGLYSKVAEMLQGQTLFDRASQGNLLQMDKWARVVNDAWILGGVHRHGLFRLASPRVMENLWNKSGGYFVVTAREILGLLNFGYQHEQIGPWQCLVCRNKARAAAANLIEYGRLATSNQTIQQASELQDKEGSAARVQKQIGQFGGR